MAIHKVPQDVEADDKLIGFLSLKQFIFTIIGIGFGYMTFFFATRIHPLSAVLWLPFTLIFLVLGLYQRKDQPAEVYLASAIRFYLKPRKRKWDQEGYEERVKITAPPVIEKHYTKDFTGEEAYSRLTSLSRLMDSRGWASRLGGDWQNPQLAAAAASDRIVSVGGMGQQRPGVNVQAYTQPVDVMDEQTSLVAQQFQARIQQVDDATHQQAIQALQQARQEGVAQPSTGTSASTQATTNDEASDQPTPAYQKYPEMHQKVIAPAEETSSGETTPADEVGAGKEDTATKQPVVKEKDMPEQHVTEDGSIEISLH